MRWEQMFWLSIITVTQNDVKDALKPLSGSNKSDSLPNLFKYIFVLFNMAFGKSFHEK